MSEFAELRSYVFNPKSFGEHTSTFGSRTYTRVTGFLTLVQDAMRTGLGGTAAVCYATMLWQAGPKLDHSVNISQIARDIGRSRVAVHRAIDTLTTKGMIARANTGNTLGKCEFRFRPWTNTQSLIEKAEAAKQVRET